METPRTPQLGLNHLLPYQFPLCMLTMALVHILGPVNDDSSIEELTLTTSSIVKSQHNSWNESSLPSQDETGYTSDNEMDIDDDSDEEQHCWSCITGQEPYCWVCHGSGGVRYFPPKANLQRDQALPFKWDFHVGEETVTDTAGRSKTHSLASLGLQHSSCSSRIPSPNTQL